VVAGRTVTVMTDITEQKAAERDVLEATRRTEEANKLNTEKNRMLEALSSEPRDKNRQLEEQAAQIAEWNARLETRVTEQVAQIGPPRIFSKVEPQIEAEPVGELSLKGFHRPVFAHNVLGIRPEA
jgi:hypothetical protein